jgi:signal-transduction protein with cAMP-binding, CBS, and nucleotidyltransferase domain
MYFEGLNSDFTKWMAEKVKYNLYIKVSDVLTSSLFSVTSHDNYYEVLPLFNFDSVTSSNPNDNTTNNKVLILLKDNDTMLSFKSDMPIMDYSEMKTETTIEDIKYTLYYTYDSTTSEPASGKMTSSGNTTDEHGYYVDSEVVT